LLINILKQVSIWITAFRKGSARNNVWK